MTATRPRGRSNCRCCFVCRCPSRTTPCAHAFAKPSAPRRGSVVGATYALPLAGLTDTERAEEEACLTVQARTSFGAAPPPYQSWFVEEGHLHMPRFYGLQRFGAAETDLRTLGDEFVPEFVGTLTAVQQRAHTAVFGKQLHPTGDGGVMVCLPCGYGKTVWAVHAIAALGRKACVVVHKTFLRDQWANAFATFCPGVRVGHIQGKVADVADKDVVIAMIMTLTRREACDLSSFGTVCFDECHHVAAPVMNLATRMLHARYVIGLTATKDRPDGLTPLLYWSVGPEGFRAERDSETVRVSAAHFEGGAREILHKGRPLGSVMINHLAAHPARNAFLASRIVAMRQAGRVILVLSDRLAQLTTLRTLVLHAGIPPEEVGLFTGTTKDADRVAQLARAVVFCSYGMANEGLDKREADTCVMATPKARVTQCVGRIQRPCATKQPPLVLDVVDDAAFFTGLWWARHKLYRKEGYEVQQRGVDGGGDWFL